MSLKHSVSYSRVDYKTTNRYYQARCAAPSLVANALIATINEFYSLRIIKFISVLRELQPSSFISFFRVLLFLVPSYL